jgi:hypothetical protein
MLHFSSSIIFVTLLWNFAWAVPVQIEKRIDQTISDSTKAWQQACVGYFPAILLTALC